MSFEVKENFVEYLDMGSNFIYNVKTPTNIDQAANKGYVDEDLSDSETAAGMIYVAKLELDNYLKTGGSVSMTGNLNMNQQKITNLKALTSNKDGTTKIYVDDALSLKASAASAVQPSIKKLIKHNLMITWKETEQKKWKEFQTWIPIK